VRVLGCMFKLIECPCNVCSSIPTFAVPLQEVFAGAVSSTIKAEYDFVLGRRWFINIANGGMASKGELVMAFECQITDLLVHQQCNCCHFTLGVCRQICRLLGWTLCVISFPTSHLLQEAGKLLPPIISLQLFA
jgi:hypothetical protein